jgi:hypothetical protein
MDCIDDKYSDIATEVIQKIIEKFGYEFCQEEFTLPLELGGWTRKVDEGINLCLLEASRIEGFKTRAINLLREDKTSFKRDPRGTKKVNPKRFSSILKLGWEEDPTLWSWTRMAEQTFNPIDCRGGPHYITNHFVSRYKKRQQLWKLGMVEYPFVEINNFLERKDRKADLYALPGEMLVEAENWALPCAIPDFMNDRIWYRDRQRMWFTILERLNLSKVSVWNPWKDIPTEVLLRECLRPSEAILEIYQGEPVPLEYLMIDTFVGSSPAQLSVLGKMHGFSRVPQTGTVIDKVALEVLQSIIPGKGNSIIWDPVIGEPWFINDIHVWSLYRRFPGGLDEDIIYAITKSSYPSINREEAEEALGMLYQHAEDLSRGTGPGPPTFSEFTNPEQQELVNDTVRDFKLFLEAIGRTSCQHEADPDVRQYLSQQILGTCTDEMEIDPFESEDDIFGNLF